MKTTIVLLAISAALFTQGDRSSARSQTRSNAPDVRIIVESSIAATWRNWEARLHYTYVERDEDQRRDSAGRVQSDAVDISQTILVNGVQFEQLVERNGRPPSAEEGRKQKEKLDKLRRETSAHRAERLHSLAEENASLFREVPKAFDFQLIGEDVINGRLAYVLQATPRPDYHGQGKYSKMLGKVKGKLWVDKQDFGWIKVQGQVVQPFSMGLFLVRVLGGTQITMEQTRVEGGIWMPEQLETSSDPSLRRPVTFGCVAGWPEPGEDACCSDAAKGRNPSAAPALTIAAPAKKSRRLRPSARASRALSVFEFLIYESPYSLPSLF